MSTKKISIPIILVMVFFLNEIVFGQTQNITICPGESVTLEPTETNAFAYSWSPNISLNAINIQKPTARPTVTTTYSVTSSIRANDNLVINGDFELGDHRFKSEYTFAAAILGFTQGNYGVSNNAKLYNRAFSSCNDHTGGVGGKMIIADGACGTNNVAKNANLWIQEITVTPNTDYAFSAWMTNIVNNPALRSSYLRFSINGMVIGTPPPT